MASMNPAITAGEKNSAAEDEAETGMALGQTTGRQWRFLFVVGEFPGAGTVEQEGDGGEVV
ncbi:hypothetical protein KSP39_PZI022427 [Platanthera zijinensis]|uniref:Uncharacterized protein n=1 Tax=Platanthera zijinensis TaxID=2320716 RepID=A0AAP0AWH8_9ASPA